METKHLYLKIADVDMENQGSNNESLLLSPPRHRKGIRIGVVIFCLFAVAFFIIHCCPLFQTYKAHHHHLLDYSQADSFYASNDPPYPYYDDEYNYDSSSGSSNNNNNNSNEQQQQQQQQHIYVEAPTASPTGQQQHIYYAWKDVSYTNKRLKNQETMMTQKQA